MTGVGWRWTFLLPVPIALAALAAAFVLLPKDKPAEEGGHDLARRGALHRRRCCCSSTPSSPHPTSAGPRPAPIGSFVLVAALVAAFVFAESRVKHPLIRLGILRKATLVRASLAIVAVAGSYFSWQFIVTLYLQDTLGWSPLKLALALLPVGLMVAASSVFSDKLVNRFGTTRIIGGHDGRDGGRLPAVPAARHSPSYLTMLLPALLLIGVGWIGFPAINIQATAGVDDEEQGLAAGVLQTSMQVGAAIVLAVTTAMITSGTEGAATPADVLDGFRPGLVFAAAVSIAGALVALLALVPRRRTADEPTSRVLEPEPELASDRPPDDRSGTADAPRPLGSRGIARSGCTMPHGSATIAGARGGSGRARRSSPSSWSCGSGRRRLVRRVSE